MRKCVYLRFLMWKSNGSKWVIHKSVVIPFLIQIKLPLSSTKSYQRLKKILLLNPKRETIKDKSAYAMDLFKIKFHATRFTLRFFPIRQEWPYHKIFYCCSPLPINEIGARKESKSGQKQLLLFMHPYPFCCILLYYLTVFLWPILLPFIKNKRQRQRHSTAILLFCQGSYLKLS